MQTFMLSPHPSERAPPAVLLSASLDLKGDIAHIIYELEGALEGLSLPLKCTASRGTDLWKTTCFEIFLKPHGALHYYEYNFSPSSMWDCLRFSDVRERSNPIFEFENPLVDVIRHADCLTVSAHFELPKDIRHNPKDLAIGISAVLQDKGGDCSYWALRHGTETPDFHDQQNFSAHFI